MQGSREEPRAPHGLGGAGVGRRPERPSAIPGLPSGRAGVLPAGDPRLGGTAGRPRTLLLSEARRRLPAVAAKRPRGPTWPPPLPPQSRASRGAPAAGARGGGGGHAGRSPTRSPEPDKVTGARTRDGPEHWNTTRHRGQADCGTEGTAGASAPRDALPDARAQSRASAGRRRRRRRRQGGGGARGRPLAPRPSRSSSQRAAIAARRPTRGCRRAGEGRHRGHRRTTPSSREGPHIHFK